MKQRTASRFFSCVFAGLALGGLHAAAQTNFWWTNLVAGNSYNWSTNANWTNDLGGATAPAAGGANNYVLDFASQGAVASFNMTNTLGVAVTNGFLLNQFNFNNAPAAALYGSNLVFISTGAGTLPTFNQNGASNFTLAVGVVLSNNTTFGGSGSGTIAVSNVISGPAKLTMNGAGYVLVLTSANTYTNTTLSAGTLQIGNGAASGAVLGTITNNSAGGALIFYRSDSSTVSNSLIGAGTNIFRGTGGAGATTYNLTGANVETGPMILDKSRVTVTSQGQLGNPSILIATNAGTLYATAGTYTNAILIGGNGWLESGGPFGTMRLQGATWNGTVGLLADAKISSYGGNGTVGGSITGAYALTIANQNGSQSLTLGGSNTYAGNTTLGVGVLQLGSSNALPATSLLTINAGGSLAVTNAASALYTTVTDWMNSGRIASNGAAGTLALTFSSAENIDFNTAGGSYSNFYLGAVGTVTNSGTLTPYNNIYRLGGGGGVLVLTNDLALVGASALVVNDPANVGTVTLTGSNSFSGGTTVNTGVLVLNNNNAPGTGQLVMKGGVLSNALNGAVYTNTISLQAAATINTPANTITTFNGPITNTGALTINAGPAAAALGKVQLLGSNTFSGNFFIGAGQVLITNAAALGTGAKTISITAGSAGQPTLILDGSGGSIVLSNNMSFATSTANGSGSISNAAGNNVINGNFTLQSGGGNTLIMASGGSLTFNGNFLPSTGNSTRSLVMGGIGTGIVNGIFTYLNTTDLVTITKQDAGTWIVTGNSTNSGTTTINGGTLQVGSGGASGTLSTNTVTVNSGATLAFARSDTFAVSNAISGAGSVAYNGPGYATFNAPSNTYTGGTVINGGLLGFATTSAVPVKAGGISNNLGGAVVAAGAFTNVTGWLASGRLATNSAGALALISNSTEAVSFGVYTNLSLGAVLGSNVTYNGVYTPVTNLYRLGGGGGTLNFAPTIGGTAGLLINGAGTVVLLNTNGYTGGTIISNGVLSVSSDANLGATGNALAVNGGILQVQGVTLNSFVLHPLSGVFSGGFDVASPYNAVVVATNLTGSGSLAKLGAGYLILQNTNTYTGGTTVSNGTLRLLAGGGNNLLATNGALTVAGGTLDLAGSGQTTTNTVSFQGGVVQGGSLTAPMATLDARAGLVAVDLTLTGGAPLVKNSSGYLTLLGNNTYSGGTVLSNGQLAIVSDANIGGTSSAITFAGGGLTILGSALANLDSHSVNWGALPAGTVLDIATSGSVFTVANSIGGSSLIKDGAGTLALTGNNTFNGALTVRGGTLNINDDAALGVVPAAPFTNLVFSGSSILQAGAPTLTLSANRSLLINSGVTLTLDDEGGVFTINGALTGAGGLTKVDTGTTVLAGTNTYSGATVVSAGTLTFAGPGTNALGAVTVNGGLAGAVLNVNAPVFINNNNILVGTVAGDRSTLIINTNLTTIYTANSAGRMFVGNNAGANGAVIQNAGTTTVNFAQGGADILSVGYNGGYGYYQMNGGVLNAGQLAIVGNAGSGSIGVFDQNGGTVTVGTGGWLLMSWVGNSTGVINVANGTMNSPNDGNPFTMSFAGGKNFDVVNVLGNGVLNAIGNGSVALDMTRSANTGLGDYLNIINGGLVMANKIQSTNTGMAWLSFNGGTLQAKGGTNQMAFLQGLSNVVIYAGGATIDSSNSTIGIAQNLLAPTGTGVTGITLAGGGAGYIGAPVVIITGGGGVGATGIAQVDINPLDAQYGQVTNILITSAGYGYTYLPVVTLAGGGALMPATLGAVTTNAVLGGALTKQGPGNLILSGTNTYTGGTMINEGVLAFATTNALPTTPAAGGITINAGGALAMTGAFANAAAWLAGGDIASNSTGALALSLADGATSLNLPAAGYSNLFVGALGSNPVFYTGTLTFNNNDYRLGGGGGTLAITNDLSGNSLTIGLPGTTATNTVALNGNLAFSGGITVNSNALLSLAAPTTSAITLINAGLQVRGTVLNDLPINPVIAGGVVFDINNPGNSFTIATNLTVGGSLAKLGSGTLVLGGSNGIAGNVLVAAGALRLTSGDAFDGVGSNVTVASGASLQLQGGITTGAGDLLVLNGGGLGVSIPGGNSSLPRNGALRNVSGSNTWAGPIVLGSIARINSDADLLTLAGPISNNISGVISMLGGAGNTLITGMIAGTGAWGKDGAGTVTLTASNLYTGGTYIYGGTLLLDYGAAGAPASQIISASSPLTMGNPYNGIQPTLLVNGPAAGTATQTFAGMTINQGYSSVVASNNGGAVIVNLGALTRSAGSYLDITPPGGSGRVTSNQGTNTSGVLASYITINGTDWGTLGANNAMVAFTGYTSLTGAGPVLPNGTQYVVRVDNGSTDNIDNGAGTNLIHNLSVTDPTARTITFSGSGLLRLGGNSTSGQGGLLLAPGAGGLTIGSVANEGLLTAGYTNNGTAELMVFNNSANGLTLNSALINNGTGNLTVTIGGFGAGAITLAGTNNIGGRMYVAYPGATTFSGITNTLGGLTLLGGTVNINSPMTLNGSLVADLTAVVNINMPVMINGAGLTSGGTANSRVVINMATNVTLSSGQRLQEGTGNNSASAINQTGGTFLNNGNTVFGDGTANYAAYRITGGLLTTTGGGINVGWQSMGVVDVLGGAIVATNSDFGIAVGTSPSSNQVSIVTVNGGFLGVAGSSGNLRMNETANAHSFAQLSVLSGGVDLTYGMTNRYLDILNSAGNTGIVNLVGGSITANQIKATSAAGLSVLNLNGGSIVVSPTSSLAGTFMQGLSAAYVYGGGVNIDTDTNTVTILQNLAGVTGFGVSSIALLNNGAGYIGAPAVTIAGGSGTGATAIAQFDPVAGQVTNILITSAGVGYLPTDALTLQMIGGGFTNEAVFGAYNLAANVNNGGLTKNGTGTLTLTGTNSYGGTTLINAGTLVFQPAATATNTLGNLSGSGAMQHNGLGMTILNGDGSTFTGSATINTGTVQFANFGAVPVNSNVLVNTAGTVALDFGGGNVQAALSNGIAKASTGVIALTPNSAGESVNFNTAGLTAAYLGAAQTMLYDLANYTPAVAGTWRLGGGGGTLVITNGISAGDALVIGGVSGAVQAGGAYNLSSLTVNSGALFNVGGNNQTLGALSGGAGTILNTNSAVTLTVGGAGSSTIFGGGINGAIGLTKVGAGTLTLTNANGYIGATLISQGTLQLAPTTNQAGLAEGWAAPASAWAPNSLTNIGFALYPRFAETNFATSGAYPPVWPARFSTNVTIGYSGYIYNNTGSNVTWSFASRIDDGSQLVIDGAIVMGSAGTVDALANYTLTPGAHTIDYRIQNGGGGAGSYGIFGMGTGANTIGFGYDPLGRLLGVASAYQIPMDPGNGTLFTSGLNILPASAVVQIASGATLDLNGAQQLITGLSDPFTAPGAGGVVTNSQTALTSILTLNPPGGSNFIFSGNIVDAGVANAITLIQNGAGTQVLAGTNTYSGGTLINTGVLQFAVAQAVSPNSNILISAGGAAAFDFAGIQSSGILARINTTSVGSLALTTNSAAENLDFKSFSLSNLYLGAIGNVAYTGTFTNFGTTVRLGGGGGTLTMVNPILNNSLVIGGGSGTVVLTNSLNSYTGTVINAGTLQVGADGALGAIVGGATNLAFLGTGTLQAGAAGVTLGATRTILVTNGVNGILDNNGYNFTVNGNILGGGTLVSVGAGTNTLGGLTNTVLGIMARSGTLAFAPGSSNNISGLNNSTSFGLQVAPVAGDRAVVLFNPTAGATNVILGSLRVGNATNAAGAVYQTGGLVWQNGATAIQAFSIGSGGGYGYYNITGGTVMGSQMEISGINVGAGGVGVMDILGGTVAPSNYFIIGRSANGIGVVNVASGGVLLNPINTSGISFGWDANANEYGVLNILSGGLVNAGFAGRAIDLGATAGGNTGIMNLNSGGTALVYQITRSQAGTGILNLNGGLLIASNNANATLINGNLTAAYVYPGGVTLSNNVASAIMQPLLAPTGYGVTNIALVNGGTNYIGAPAIMITGGSGLGATAIAQINAAGVITNILITSYGSGYLPSDTLTVQLLGGGATAAGALGTVTLGLNGSSGGVVKTGTGTLILGTNNTYGGATIISQGNLQLGNGNYAGAVAGNVIFSNTASWLGYGRADTVTNSLAYQTPNGNLAALVQNGPGLLVFTNTTFQYNSVAVSNGLVLFATAATIPGSNSIILARGGGVLVTNLYGSVNGWLNSGMLTNNAGGGLLALTTGVNTENINWVAGNGTVYSNMYLGVAPGSVATFLGTLTPVGTNYLVGGGGGTLVIGNDNAFADPNILTNRSVTFGNGSLTSTVYVLGPQNYTGGTTISNALVSISADNNLGYGNITLLGEGDLQITNAPNFSTIKTITFNTSGGSNYLDIGSGSTATLYGAVTGTSNSRSIQKLGGGTLILSNNVMLLNTTLFLKQGTTIVDSGATLTNGQFMDVAQIAGDNAALIVRGTGQILATGDFNIGDVGGTGVMTVQDSANLLLNGVGGTTYIGKTGTGTLNMNGGAMSVGNLYVSNGGTGTNNLNGGVLTIRGTYVTKNGGTGVFNFNGGTLRAGNNFTFSNLFNVATVNGSSFLDSSNYTVTLNQAFTGSGTLTKLGSGTVMVYSPSNTFAGLILSNGLTQFAGTNGMTPGRTLYIGSGAAAGYTNNGILDQNFLLRVAPNSMGVVGLTVSNNTAGLDFNGAGLTNVSLGAIGGTFTNNGVFTNFGSTYRLGGGGGTLVITNNIAAGNGTNMIAFGNGGTGTLILTGTNAWSSSIISNGVVRYGSAVSMGTNVTVTTGGAFANNGALDTNLFARLNTASDGAFALVANNAAGGINLGAYASLSLGAAGGSWTNDGVILPNGTTYRLGGGGGTLVITNSTLLAGAGTNLVAFGGSNYGNLVLTGTNTYDGGTLIGSLGTVTVNNVALGGGAVTNNGTLVYSQASVGNVTNVISGAGTVTFTGGGMVTLTAANTYTGNTVLGSSTTLTLSNTTGAAVQGNVQVGAGGAAQSYLVMGAGNQFGSNTVISFNTAAAGAFGRFVLNGTTQSIAGLSAQPNMGLVENTDAAQSSAAGPSVLIISNGVGSSYTYNGGYIRNAFTGGASNTLGLVKDGLGTQILMNGTNFTFTGPTLVQNGTLVLSNTTTWVSPVTINNGQLLLASAGNTTVMNQMVTNNAYNGLTFANGTAFNIGGLAGSGSIMLWSQTGGGVTLSVGGNNSNSTYSGTLTDVGPGNFYQGNLVKNGSGTLTLTGINTYNGYNLINLGILQADVGVGLSPYANTTIAGGSLASISGLITNAVGLGANQFNILNGGFSAVGTPTTVSLGGLDAPITLTWGTPGFSPATFTLNETNANNTLTLLNNINLNGATNVVLSANATNPSLLAVVSGVISDSVGTSTLTKRGAGTLVFAAANTYSGATYIAGGNLDMTNDLLGVAGAPLYLTNNGALEASGSFTLNNRAVLVQTGGGKFNVDGGATLQITNNLTSTGGALSKLGSGTLVLAAGAMRSAISNGINVNAGTVLLTNNNLWVGSGAASIGQNAGDVGTVIMGQDSTWFSYTNGVLLNVGNAGQGTLIIQDNAVVASNRLIVGNALTSAGAVYQRGGTSVWQNGSAADGRIGMTGYGYYEISGGSLRFNGFTQIGHDLTGVGVMSQLGGSVLQTNVQGGNLELSRGGIGVYNMLGGSFVAPPGVMLSGTSDNGMSNGTAIFNMQGGTALIAGNITMGSRSNMVYSILNMNGGVLTLNQITCGTVTNSLALVNFNGGTLQARQSGSIIAAGANAPDGTYIYAGGATLDASNYVVTVPINLQAPQGDGVTGIDLGAPSLSGYIGSPYVQIAGGGGTGATAYAQFDSVAGLVTGIVMTSYGYGYTSDPTVMLVGNITNTLGTLTRTANTSGSLTINGATNGAVILSGTNTYGGGTFLTSGSLLFASSNAMPAGTTTILVPYGSAFGVTNAASASYTNINDWLASGIIDLNSSGTMALAFSTLATDPALDLTSGGGYPNMAIGAFAGLTVYNNAALATVNGSYRLGGGWGTLALTNTDLVTGANWLNAFPAGSGGGLQLYASNSYSGGTLIGYSLGTVMVNNAYSMGTGPVTNNGTLVFNNTSGITNMSGAISGTGNVVVGSGAQFVMLLTSNSYAGGTWLTGGNGSVYLGDDNALGSGTIWVTGNNPSIASTGMVTRTLANNIVLSNNVTFGTTTHWGNLVINGNVDLSGGSWIQTVTAATVINGVITNGSLVKAGASNLTLNAANTYAGTTTIRQGTLTMGNAAALPTNTTLTFGDGKTLSGTLDMNNGYSATLAALSTVVTNTINSTALTNSVVNIAAGQALSVVSTANSNVVEIGTGTHLVMSGGGAFNINDPNGNILIWGRVNGSPSFGGLDLSQLGQFTAAVSNITVSLDPSGAGAQRYALLALAGTNTITANTIYLGQSVQSGSGIGWLQLGMSNALSVANLYISNGKSSGTVTFASGLVNPSLTLAGTNGARANVTIGQFLNGGSNTQPGGNLTLTNTGSTIYAQIDRLLLGALDVSSGGPTMGVSGAFTFNGGTVDINTAVVARSLAGATTGYSAGVLTMNGGVLNINSNFVLAQRLAASGAVTGTVNFAGGSANFYTDLLGGGGVSFLQMNGGTLDMQGHAIGASGSGFVSNLVLNSGTLQNVAEINGGRGLVKNTAGTLVLAGLNTYTGNTTNSAGVLAMGGDNVLSTGPLYMNGGTLGVTNGNWTETNTVSLLANGTVDTTGGNLTLSGPVSGNLFTLTKNGANLLTLAGAVNYPTNVIVNAGTLLNNGTLTITNGSGASLGLQVRSSSVLTNSGVINMINGKLQLYDSAVVDNTGTITNNTGIVLCESGNPTNTVLNNYAGGSIYMGSGILYGGIYGTGTVNNLGGSLTLAGSASLYLGGGNAAGGKTNAIGTLNVNAGLVNFNSTGSFRLGNNDTNSTGVLNLNGGTLALSKQITMGTGPGVQGFVNFNGGVLSGTVNNVTLLGSDITAVTVLSNGAWVALAGGITNTIAAVLADGGNGGGLTKLGAGVLVLGGASTYTGATTNLGGGTINLNINNALPQTTTLYADDLSTFNIGAFNQQVAGLDGSHGTISAAAGGALTVNFGASQTFYGTLTGPGTLTLTGGGTMNLLGTNSFSVGTLVSNATYYVNGLHNGGMITVLSNGLVGGSGPISSLYVDQGGTYAPGNSIATQKVGSLTLTNAGLLALELGNNANDQVIVTNSLTIAGGQIKLNLAAYSFIPNATITLVDWTTASGFAPNNPAQWFTLSDAGGPNDGMVWSNGVMLGVSGGLAGSTNFFTINYDDLANGVASTHGITLTAVPEPGTAALLGLMGLAFLVRRLRTRKTAQA